MEGVSSASAPESVAVPPAEAVNAEQQNPVGTQPEQGTDPSAETVTAKKETTTAAAEDSDDSEDSSDSSSSSDESSTDSSQESSSDQPIPQETATVPSSAPITSDAPAATDNVPSTSAQPQLTNVQESETSSDAAPSNAPIISAEPIATSAPSTSSSRDQPAVVEDNKTALPASDPVTSDTPSIDTTSAPAAPTTTAEPVTTAAPSDTSPKPAPEHVDSAASPSSAPAREGRVALILRINKELIRMCVELQAKEMTGDPLFREVAVRLQGNLGYLASIADKKDKTSADGRPTAQQSAPPKLEAFPRTSHAPTSPLPALYDKLIGLFQQQSGTNAASPAALLDARKRSRDASTDSEEIRKRMSASDTAAKGVNGDPSTAGTPTATGAQQTAMQQPTGGPNLALAPPVPIASPQSAPSNNPQTQALIQAFGPNALANLHALQTHMRGQGKHPWIAFMETNMPNFTTLPLQVQMQQMTAMQVSAQQYQQKAQAMQGAAAGSPAHFNNGTSPYPQLGHASGSPSGMIQAGVRNASSSSSSSSPSLAAQSRGMTGHNAFASPAGTRPGSSGSVGSGSGRPRTGSQQHMLDFDPTSAAFSTSSPASSTFAFADPSSGGGGGGGSAQGQNQNVNMGMNLQNLPPHIQQQYRQQYFAQMQAAQQAQQQQQQQSQDAQGQTQGQGWNFQS